jgi:hypothetical protein
MYSCIVARIRHGVRERERARLVMMEKKNEEKATKRYIQEHVMVEL